MRKAIEWLALVAVLAGGLVLVPGAPGPWQEPVAAAPIVSGLEWVHRSELAVGYSPITATATCPPWKVVLGGGGWASLPAIPNVEVALTRLEPVDNLSGNPVRHGYVATGALTRLAELNEPWRIHAYALCADELSLPGHHIVEETTDQDHAVRKEAIAHCPGSFRVLGTGAKVNNSTDHNTLLQVARATGPGDATRAQAHEDVDGNPVSWSLTAFAVCSSRPEGYEIAYGESNARASETRKDATARCPDGKRMISAGAAVTNVAPANVSLMKVFPSSSLREASATAVENVPTNVNWDFMVAQAICVL